jgi:hypothetical protein
MPMPAWLNKTTRVALIVGSCSAGLLTVERCGPPEAGSVKLPEDLKRSGPISYGPITSKGGSPSLGPGDFGPAWAPKNRPSRR